MASGGPAEVARGSARQVCDCSIQVGRVAGGVIRHPTAAAPVVEQDGKIERARLRQYLGALKRVDGLTQAVQVAAGHELVAQCLGQVDEEVAHRRDGIVAQRGRHELGCRNGDAVAGPLLLPLVSQAFAQRVYQPGGFILRTVLVVGLAGQEEQVHAGQGGCRQV